MDLKIKNKTLKWIVLTTSVLVSCIFLFFLFFHDREKESPQSEYVTISSQSNLKSGERVKGKSNAVTVTVE